MKQDINLIELAKKLEVNKAKKKDIVLSTDRLTLEKSITNNDLAFGINSDEMPSSQLAISDVAHTQIASHLDIPKRYYDKMRFEDNQSLLKENIKHWFEKNPKPRMLRLFDEGKNELTGIEKYTCRAFLSDKYKRIDNELIAEGALPALQEMPNVQIKSCSLTDKNMYIKAVLPQLSAIVKEGDVVQSGLLIRNSEVGFGAVEVSMLIYRLVCDNGLVVQDGSTRKTHIGTKLSESYDLLSTETLIADAHTLKLAIRDIVKNTANEVLFLSNVKKMKELSESSEMNKPNESIKILAKQYGLAENEQEGVLASLIKGGDLTAWGMLNAVTDYSKKADSYERATELERIGGKILDLNPNQWKVLQEVA
tara:strand:- start:415 stop:1512 length:1098 start_codon:yes stop_codon:yes gene_type:complete